MTKDKPFTKAWDGKKSKSQLWTKKLILEQRAKLVLKTNSKILMEKFKQDAYDDQFNVCY